jgi:hypothetical protein
MLAARMAGAALFSASAWPVSVTRTWPCWSRVVRSSTTSSGLPAACATRSARRGPGGPPASCPASARTDSGSSGPRSSTAPPPWRAASTRATTGCWSVGRVVATISTGYCRPSRMSRRSTARLELSTQCRLSITNSSSAVVHNDSNTPVSASTRLWTSTGTSSRGPGQAWCPSMRRARPASAGSADLSETPSASEIAPNGLVRWSSLASDALTTMPRAWAALAISWTRRVFPRPASPCRTSTPPRPVSTAASHRRTWASSRSRPTRRGGVSSGLPPINRKSAPPARPSQARPPNTSKDNPAGCGRTGARGRKIRNYYGGSLPAVSAVF